MADTVRVEQSVWISRGSAKSLRMYLARIQGGAESFGALAPVFSARPTMRSQSEQSSAKADDESDLLFGKRVFLSPGYHAERSEVSCWLV